MNIINQKENNVSNNKLSKNAKFLIVSDLMYSATDIFVNTFLVAYFVQVTNESTFQISLFYIIDFSLIGLGYLLIGRYIKTNSKYNNKILSIGTIMRGLFIFFIAILKEKIIIYFPLIAIFYAIAESFYWVAHESIYIDVTTNKNRKDYMALANIFSKLISIIIPIILGASIELYSFSKIAIYVLFISLIQIVAVFQIRNTNNNETKQTEKYSITKFQNSLSQWQKNKIDKYLISAIFYGVIESATRSLVTIITIMTFKTSINLGILTSVFSICSMATLYLYKKAYNKKTSKFILYTCSTLILIGVIGVIIDINKFSLIIYNLLYTISIAILSAVYNTKKGDLIKECNIEKWKTEFITYLELFIVCGRVFGYILILISGLFNSILIIKLLLIIVSIFAPLHTKLMYEVEKNKDYS